MVSGSYQWYIPLFIDRISKEYPEYDIRVLVVGDIDSDILGIPGVFRADAEAYPSGPYTTAALRFVYEDAVIRSYDYVLLTDVDMLIYREDPTIVDQHMRDLHKNGLRCYSNYVSTIHDSSPRLPGVHFVTKDWWDITRDSRTHYAEYLLKNGSPAWWFDEVMLYNIAKESGLKIQNTALNLWCHHGIHIGDYRRSIIRNEPRSQPDAYQQLYMKKILGDDEFMRKVTLSAVHIPTLVPVFDMFRSFLA